VLRFSRQCFAPAGFTFHLTNNGNSSGGDFATGRFTKGTQDLELHFRHSLGMVRQLPRLQ